MFNTLQTFGRNIAEDTERLVKTTLRRKTQHSADLTGFNGIYGKDSNFIGVNTQQTNERKDSLVYNRPDKEVVTTDSATLPNSAKINNTNPMKKTNKLHGNKQQQYRKPMATANHVINTQTNSTTPILSQTYDQKHSFVNDNNPATDPKKSPRFKPMVKPQNMQQDPNGQNVRNIPEAREKTKYEKVATYDKTVALRAAPYNMFVKQNKLLDQKLRTTTPKQRMEARILLTPKQRIGAQTNPEMPPVAVTAKQLQTNTAETLTQTHSIHKPTTPSTGAGLGAAVEAQTQTHSIHKPTTPSTETGLLGAAVEAQTQTHSIDKPPTPSTGAASESKAPSQTPMLAPVIAAPGAPSGAASGAASKSKAPSQTSQQKQKEATTPKPGAVSESKESQTLNVESPLQQTNVSYTPTSSPVVETNSMMLATSEDVTTVDFKTKAAVVGVILLVIMLILMAIYARPMFMDVLLTLICTSLYTGICSMVYSCYRTLSKTPELATIDDGWSDHLNRILCFGCSFVAAYLHENKHYGHIFIWIGVVVVLLWIFYGVYRNQLSLNNKMRALSVAMALVFGVSIGYMLSKWYPPSTSHNHGHTSSSSSSSSSSSTTNNIISNHKSSGAMRCKIYKNGQLVGTSYSG